MDEDTNELDPSCLQAYQFIDECPEHHHQHSMYDFESSNNSKNHNLSKFANPTAFETGEKLTKGKQKIPIEFICNRSKRYSTFSKRKTGLMKKAVELAELTGAEVLLLIASETNHVYTFATQRLKGIVELECGKKLIQTCLSSNYSDLYNTHDSATDCTERVDSVPKSIPCPTIRTNFKRTMSSLNGDSTASKVPRNSNNTSVADANAPISIKKKHQIPLKIAPKPVSSAGVPLPAPLTNTSANGIDLLTDVISNQNQCLLSFGHAESYTTTTTTPQTDSTALQSVLISTNHESTTATNSQLIFLPSPFQLDQILNNPGENDQFHPDRASSMFRPGTASISAMDNRQSVHLSSSHENRINNVTPDNDNGRGGGNDDLSTNCSFN